MKKYGFPLFLVALFVSPAFAQAEQATSVEVEHGVVSLTRRAVQVRADSFSYEGGRTTLTGNVAITVANKNGVPTRISAKVAHVETALVEVQIGIGSLSEFPAEEGKLFKASLEAASQSPNFRINWHEQFGMSGDDVTALYNRPEKTLNFYNIRWWSDNVLTRHLIYLGVDDSNVIGLLFSHRDSGFAFRSKNKDYVLPKSTDIPLPDGVKRRILP